VRLTSGERAEPMRCRFGHVDAGIALIRAASGRSLPGAMAISLWGGPSGKERPTDREATVTRVLPGS